MKKQYLSRTWVNPKFKAGKSKIHGDGVFAGEKISEGERVMEFGGELISKEEAFSGNYRFPRRYRRGSLFRHPPLADDPRGFTHGFTPVVLS